jgi:hypothetical protein
MPNPRYVYMMLSPRSLSYSRGALESLSRNFIEPIQLRLITDSKHDREERSDAGWAVAAGPHRWAVYSEEDFAEREETLLAGYDDLRAFRRGRPCWRKITDPLPLAPEIGGRGLDRSMHVVAIGWAALETRIGRGHPRPRVLEMLGCFEMLSCRR